MRGTHAGQRRRLRRVEVEGLAIRWNVHHRPKSWLRQETTIWDEGLVVNSSVEGACIAAPVNVELSPGTVVEIADHEFQGTVTVRWARESDEPKVMLYGVRYMDVDPYLVARLMEVPNTVLVPAI